ncbi:hypothetical protein E2C01_019709 [Portunus trituberculatus]|uniref:Uncharacterized protein n=1 Tax=Portunus trituberculatus TaxID=210409 RepID=A0A5B7DZQ3_PORTR|nr:hypothetical protein [Portunus trituberculatus]
MFFRLLLSDKTALLLYSLLRLQWQNTAILSFLMDELATIMASHSCQIAIIVGDLDEKLVSRAFTWLTTVRSLTNYVNFITHVRGAFLDPVLTDIP